MITIAEYNKRVKRLAKVLPDFESGYNDDEGLTLAAVIDDKDVVFVGEPEIVLDMEKVARAWLARLAEALQ